MNGVQYSLSELLRDPEWDELIQQSPGSHFEQLSGWGAVKARYGWQVRRILAKAGTQLVGGVQILTRKAGRFFRIGYISRGPVTTPGYECLALELVRKIEAIAEKEFWLYGVIDHAYSAHDLAASMLERGYTPHPGGIPPSGLLNATCLVDLGGEEDQLLARMNSSVRRNIRRSVRSGLVFSEGAADGLVKFRELMEATCKRRNSSPTPPQKDYFQHLWAELAPLNRVKLFEVAFEGEVVCAAFAFTVSDTVRVWKVGWSGTQADKDPNHFMWWEIMRWGRTHGFKQLDFVWVDTVDAKRAARGALSPEGFRDGTTYFKLGFGGTLYFPPVPQSRFFIPAFQCIYRSGGRRLLSASPFQRLILRYWARKNLG